MADSSPSDGDAMAALSTELRAATAAALLHVGADAPRVLERIAGAGAAVTAAKRVLELDRRQRAGRLAAAVVALRAPTPAGLEAVHPDWRAGPDGPGPAANALRDGGPADDERTRRWLQRRAYGHLVAMPPATASGAVAVARVDPTRLVAALVVWGRRTLAGASSTAPRPQIAELATRLGEEHGAAFIAEVAAAVSDGAGPGPWARVVHGAFAARGASPRALAAIGLERLAALLAASAGDVVRQVAQALPRELGAELLARDAAHCATAAGDAGPVALDVAAELSSLLACFDA